MNCDTHHLDPINLEIYWNRLISICDQGAANFERTAFSTIIRESNDYTVALLDSEGNSLAENSGTIGAFAGCMPRTVKNLLNVFPLESWSPGDVVISNDPWIGTGHRPDVTVIAPIFYDRQIVGFTGNTGHWADVGGSIFSADTTSVYEEGIGIPPMKAVREGVFDNNLINFIKCNVRVPDMVLGDLYAQVATVEICSDLVVEFVAQNGLTDLTILSNAILGRAEQAMQRAIEAVPNGVYQSRVSLDGYDEPLHIECSIKVQDSTIEVDYAGSSDETTQGSINVVLSYAMAWTCYTLKCILDPSTLRNEGSYKPITTTAPLGSILNCRHPAPVNARHLTGRCVSSANMMALAPIVPDKVIAECGSTPDLTAVFSGVDDQDVPFSFIAMASGGMGASARGDGLACTPFPQNISQPSIEVMEAIAPLLVWRREYRKDSGGHGKHRGGYGQVLLIENRASRPINLSFIAERTKYPAQGLNGGMSGKPIAISKVGVDKLIPTKAKIRLLPTEIIEMAHGGGGGYGNPKDRELHLIKEDLKNDLIADGVAKEIYGLT